MACGQKSQQRSREGWAHRRLPQDFCCSKRPQSTGTFALHVLPGLQLMMLRTEHPAVPPPKLWVTCPISASPLKCPQMETRPRGRAASQGVTYALEGQQRRQKRTRMLPELSFHCDLRGTVSMLDAKWGTLATQAQSLS